MNQKKISLLIMAHILSLSYIHAIRYDYAPNYHRPHNTPQNTASTGMPSSAAAMPTMPPSSQPYQPTPVPPRTPSTQQPSVPMASTVPTNSPQTLNAVSTNFGSVAQYKTQFKDVTGKGYTNAIAATVVFANKDSLATNNFSTSDIMGILKAAEAPFIEKDYTKRLITLEQKNAAINLFDTFLKNIRGPKESRAFYKGKALTMRVENRFLESDEAKIEKMYNNAVNGPLTPSDLLNPNATAYTDSEAQSAITKYTTYLQNPTYLNSMLRYLKVFFDKRASVHGCMFEVYNNSSFGTDRRFKNESVKAPVAALAERLKNMVINIATDYPKTGFTSRKELIEAATDVLKILQTRLAATAGFFSHNATIKGYIPELNKIKK